MKYLVPVIAVLLVTLGYLGWQIYQKPRSVPASEVPKVEIMTVKEGTDIYHVKITQYRDGYEVQRID